MQEIWSYQQVNYIFRVSAASADILFSLFTVDSQVKQRIEADIRTAQQDMEIYEKEKVQINRGLNKIGEEDEVFKERLVSLLLLALPV